MPGLNGRGPLGGGPMTGGGRGLCNPANAGYRPGSFGGYGRGGGLGRGYRGGFRAGYGQGFRRGAAGGYGNYPVDYAGPYVGDPTIEMVMLQAQASSFQNSLDAIHKRIADLEKVSE